MRRTRTAFYPGTLEAATFDGGLFGVPLFQNINTTAYNTQIFADAGLPLPKTWDDLRSAAPSWPRRASPSWTTPAAPNRP